MVTAKFEGDTSKVTTSVSVNVQFTSLYSTAGDNVSVMFGKGGSWTVIEGTVQANGSVSMVLSADTVKSLGNDEFVLGVASK